MSGGKVVTKAGKVSCTCCAAPAVCCMYAATSAVAADLPDAITLLGVGSLAKSGTDYGDTTNGVILETGVWARYIAGVRTTNACLIDDDGNLTPGDDVVEDQFADTYALYVEYFSETVTVTRVSLCRWEGTSEDGCLWAVTYASGSYKWTATAQGDLDCGTSITMESLGPQSSPVGNYEGSGGADTGEVS